MSETKLTFIPACEVVKTYGVPRNHLSMLRRFYGVRTMPRGKRFFYCEQDVIAYVFAPKRVSLKETAAVWYLNHYKNKIPAKVPQAVRDQCMAECYVSLSSACDGLAIARGGAKKRVRKFNRIMG